MASSISDRAYDCILEQIMTGNIPAGSSISEHSLAKQLNISRTPVREAVRRLKHEGVVEQFPRLGTVVSYPSYETIRELYEFREALECYAVRHAASVATAQDIEKLEGLVEETRQIAQQLEESGAAMLEGEDLRHFLKIDMAFHQYVLKLSGNRRILKSVQESRIITRIFGTPRQVHDLSTVSGACQNHACILKHIRNGDGDAASRCMAEHISASRNKMLEHYRKMEERGVIPQISPLDVRVGLGRIHSAGRDEPVDVV